MPWRVDAPEQYRGRCHHRQDRAQDQEQPLDVGQFGLDCDYRSRDEYRNRRRRDDLRDRASAFPKFNRLEA